MLTDKDVKRPLTAAELLRLTNDAKTSGIERYFQENLVPKLMSAASIGAVELHCAVPKALHIPSLLSYVRDLGYKIELVPDQRDGDFLVISWGGV